MPVIPQPFLRPDYTGLNDAEDDLLRTYLRQRELEVVGIETAVPLGPGETLPETQPDELRRQWQESSKLKADAVVETPAVIEIVELKDFIRTSALGQLLSYRFWYDLQRQPQKPVQLWATAPDLNPSIVRPYQQAGVNVHVQSVEGERHLQQGLEASPPFDRL